MSRVSPHRLATIVNISLIALIVAPVITGAATSSGLVPCEGTTASPCNMDQLMVLVKNIIKFLLFKVATPLAAIAFAAAGIIMLTNGDNPGRITLAKSVLIYVLIGFVVALAAWLLVNAILVGLGIQSGFSLLS